MKLKNIFKHEIFILIRNLLLALFAIFLSIAINDDYLQINFLYYLYLIFIFGSFALGYLEMANLTVLGMGVTRFSIFKKFNLTILIILISLFVLSLYYDLLIILSEKNLARINLHLITFLSFVLLFSGQVGMFFANFRINKYLGSIIAILIFVLTICMITEVITIKFINYILAFSSLFLIIINYALIKNIKLQKYF